MKTLAKEPPAADAPRRVSFAPESGWEPTADEQATTELVLTTMVMVKQMRAALDAVEAQAMALAEKVATAQLARTRGVSSYRFPFRSMAGELAAAIVDRPQNVESRMAQSTTLVDRFPETFTALAAGRITKRHADHIIREGTRLADGQRPAYEASAVAYAESHTPAQLRPRARALAERAEPRTFAQRHREARDERGVFVEDLDDGMAQLRVIDTDILIHGMYDRLTRAAAHLTSADGSSATAASPEPGAEGASADTTSAGGPAADWLSGNGVAAGGNGVAAGGNGAPAGGNAAPGDKRTTDQRRADLLADLVLTGIPTGHTLDLPESGDILDAINATICVTIPVDTIVGLGDENAFLDGHGPLDADVAKRLAARSTQWQRVYLHPDTGALHTVDTYRPTAAQRRYLDARDGSCRFPGCSRAAGRCEKDHTVEYSLGGPTDVTNLACLCRGHHKTRHHSPWKVRQIRPGVLEWTSPAGRIYSVAPDEAPPLEPAPVDTTPPPF